MTASDSQGYRIIVDSAKFEKPDLDDREYRMIRLSNDLECLLIRDPNSERASAALDVNVGSVHDPPELPGLAHFCEHLLFMGTEKFPEENEYSKFLSNHGGKSNAYTSSNNTNYYFDLNAAYLEGALDRFSQFFINPLFRPDVQDREINAINSEHDKNIDNDTWRFYQVSKTTANPDHPHTNFSTGNLETLQIEPGKRGIDSRAELLKWYESHYSANVMKVCIFGNQHLHELSRLAATYFSGIQNKNLDLQMLDLASKTTPYYTPKQLTKLIKIKPIRNTKSFRLKFYVPLDDDDVHYNLPYSYISHLMGHESSGSLLHYFKVTKNWVVGLSTGFRSICDQNYIFDVVIELTEKGLEHINDITTAVFQYVNYLSTVSEAQFFEVYKELKDISSIQFKFKEKGNNISGVTSGYAHSMQDKYLTDDNKHLLLSKDYLFRHEFNYKSIKNCLTLMTPESYLAVLVNHLLPDDIYENTEKWYGVRYSVESIDPSFVNSLSQAGLSDQLHLPPLPNPFIPKDFSIKNEALRDVTPKTRPLLIEKSNTLELWFKKDDRFFSPKGSITIFFTLPSTMNNPIYSVLLNIYREMVCFKMNEFIYQASLIPMKTSFYNDSKGFQSAISGYNHNILVILRNLLQGLISFQDDKEFNNEAKFNLIKDSIIKRLKNFKLLSPYSQADTYFSLLVQDNTIHPENKLEFLLNEDGTRNDDYINFETFTCFTKLMFKQIYITSMIHGNFSEDILGQFKDILYAEFLDKIRYRRILPSQNINKLYRTILIPPGRVYRYEVDVDNTNSCVEYYFQLEDSFKMYEDLQHKKYNLKYAKRLLCIILLRSILKEPLFDQLRTKEQLGYIVSCGSSSTKSIQGFKILVQSSVKSCYYLEYRIKECLRNSIRETVLDMTDETFKNKVEALAVNLKNALRYKNLYEESSFYVSNIFDGIHNFNITKLKLQCLPQVTKQELILFFEECFLNDATSKRLIIHLKGRNEKAPGRAPDEFPDMYPEGPLVTDFDSFRNSFQMSGYGQSIMGYEYYKKYHSKDDEDMVLDSRL